MANSWVLWEKHFKIHFMLVIKVNSMFHLLAEYCCLHNWAGTPIIHVLSSVRWLAWRLWTKQHINNEIVDFSLDFHVDVNDWNRHRRTIFVDFNLHFNWDFQFKDLNWHLSHIWHAQQPNIMKNLLFFMLSIVAYENTSSYDSVDAEHRPRWCEKQTDLGFNRMLIVKHFQHRSGSSWKYRLVMCDTHFPSVSQRK
jgi:hypothetical protein